MKLELKENMYVRTKDGIIDKVTIDYNGHCASPICECKHISCAKNYYDEDKIIKASYNIINILEERDILVDDTNRKLEVLLIDNELMVRNTGLIYDNNYYLPIKSIAIKSVITHEQMEQMAYKIGD